ncbi:hypothetical protein LBMAG56_29930 [Verrucomicrobiota bacterium]|nr:hypothetical protein LBMAG56_29930 [Verrucomicrobiota bacterium]
MPPSPIAAERLLFHPAPARAVATTSSAPAPAAPPPLRITTVEPLADFKRHFGLPHDGAIIETDIDVVETDCDLNSRQRRDAEVLTTLAANVAGDCLDLGTSHGRSAYKLATNLAGRGIVHTVNILPEQYQATSGQLITHLLTKEQIGAYFRTHGITGINQIYADTCNWTMPAELRDFAVVFVDAAHDTAAVLKDSLQVFDRVKPGGYLVWHDFNPGLRRKFDWIDAVMRGVELFFAQKGFSPEIVNLRHSWMGVWRKPLANTQQQPAAAPRIETTTTPQNLPTPSPAERFRTTRFLWVYPNYGPDRVAEENGWNSRIRALGYDVHSIGIPCPDGWWPFPKLDAAWQQRHPGLLAAYAEIASHARRGDVLVACGGAMVHPEFIRQLPTLNVFTCADDPESSDKLSRPVAPAFDVSLISNLACLDLYRSWGCRHIDWLYQAIRPELTDPGLTFERILTEPREHDIVMLCERIYNASDRAQRIERLVREFPNAFVRGRGWPGGHVEPAAVYRQARIGWNLHNSIGPCNSRLVTLAAFGVMQICDNKKNLHPLFKLDEEIVGFDTLEECIDKTRYYLAHPDERRAIAARGWRRAMNDYTEPKQWEQLLTKITAAYNEKFGTPAPASAATPAHPAAVELRDSTSAPATQPSAPSQPVEPVIKEARVGIAVAADARYEPARVRELVAESLRLYLGDDRGFSAFVRAGERVLIKPNWVLHLNKSGAGMDCMVTHPAVLRAVVEQVAACRPARIVIADAPLQRCKFEELVTPALVVELRRAAAGVPVEILDFRRTVMHGDSLAADVEQERRATGRYVLFDLGADSLLEPLTTDRNFRVTCYDPDQLAKTHCRGRHQYLLARDVFEADVVINLPKLKTHRKSGLTAALKNLVGINGNKDYLPHHRFGGSDIGGDCYPGFTWWKHAAELYYDAANRVIGTPAHDVWVGRAEALFALYGRFADTDIEGGWHGNDTCWRMNLDLNRCLLYGDATGRLHDTVQRRVVSLTDALICGQGEGPLVTHPLPVGAITFSESAAAADLAHGALLRLDHRKLPLLRGCFERMRFPVLAAAQMPVFVTRRGVFTYDQLAAAIVPRGWQGHCELNPATHQNYTSCTA